MTNEEAISIIKDIKGIIYEVFPMTEEDKEQALDLAIEALKMRVNQELQIQLPNGILYAPKLFNGCAVCDKHEVCPDAFCSHSVHCNAYGIPNFHKGNENGNTYTCCGSCYLCDVDDCEADMRGGAVNENN